MKLAFIVQRYGTEILGGSEYHCRLIAERLAARHDVEVLTTCARDYITWRNDIPRVRTASAASRSGASPAPRPATSQRSTSYSDWIFQNAHTRDDEMDVAASAGAVVSRRCMDYLKRHHQSYDTLIFFTYLYAPTVLGLSVAPSQEHPRPDRARRAGNPSRHLQGDVRSARRRSRTTPRSSAVPDDALPRSAR